jgi:two-component system chemotaxis response regulator CheY
MDSGKEKIILVVDDQESIRKFIKGLLKEHGFAQVIEARDGDQALKIILTERVDLILADWRMPGMSGLELLKEVRASKKAAATPFVMITSMDQKADIMAAVQAGVSQYIVKPFTSVLFFDKLGPLLKA